MEFPRTFHNEIITQLDSFLKKEQKKYNPKNLLKIDLHCHDHNSDVPDELLGRILGVPETWLPTEELLDTLKTHGCDTFTVTNHNNARSCFEQLDKGADILIGAEFSCMVPDFKTGIHVLTYGFSSQQEAVLNRLRGDLYKFLDYTRKHELPTIWAHPLYHYKSKGVPPLDFFDKLALLFERFEVINGQRDTWQNLLVKNWLDTLTEEKINQLSAKHDIPLDRFCVNPYKKSMTGGSDSHMGMFAGLSGTRLHVPCLKQRLQTSSKSELALEAIRNGAMVPFGSHNDSEKMTVAFIDYICQIGINFKDPGLMRLVLHKGSATDKMVAFGLLNGFSEMKRHRLTTQFLQVFHDCFKGKVPGFSKRLMVSKTYKQIIKKASAIAEARKNEPETMIDTFIESIEFIFKNLNEILIQRLTKKLNDLVTSHDLSDIRVNDLISRFELPGHVRELFSNNKQNGKRSMISLNLDDFFDGLSFPFLASAVLLSATFTSAKVMYNARPLLEKFSNRLGMLQHPKRMLWLTDTFEDTNGVAMVLRSMLNEIQKRNLPIDILVCSETLKSENHLIVIPPLTSITLPFYEHQPVRIPNVIDVHNLFKQGEYDSVMCSTEGAMGLTALYLKNAYTVPAHFYVHTDWIMFARKVLNFDTKNLDRMRRILRAFYRGFDNIFVLNSDQEKWFQSSAMGFKRSKVHLTAHWVDEGFFKQDTTRQKVFGLSEDKTVLLFSGRISEEKGVMEIPNIYKNLKGRYKNLKIVFAGEGPAKKQLQKVLPEAIYLGWVEHSQLPEMYSAADLLILPSKFDTFGCVVLEALSCGLPVIAYKTKGPKDIIEHDKCGYLANTKNDMVAMISAYLDDKKLRARFKRNALKRAAHYQPDMILDTFLRNLNIDGWSN